MAQSIVDGEVLAVMGHCRNDLRRTPVGEPVHDLRDYARKTLTEAAAAGGAWADVTSDWSYTASVRIGDRAASPAEHVTALVRQSALHHPRNPDYIRGLGTPGYLTFRDGWIYQEAIEIVRAGRGGRRCPPSDAARRRSSAGSEPAAEVSPALGVCRRPPRLAEEVGRSRKNGEVPGPGPAGRPLPAAGSSRRSRSAGRDVDSPALAHV